MILIAVGVVEGKLACWILHEPEAEGIDGIHRQQKTFGNAAKLNSDPFTLRHSAFNTLHVHTVKEFRRRGMNVERTHRAAVNQRLRFPRSASRPLDGDAA